MRYLLPIILLAAMGCGSAEDRLVGKWKGELKLSQEAQATPFGAMLGGVAAMADPQLDLRPDHTFSLYMSIMPIEGTWTLQGDSVLLHPKKYGGVDPAEVQKSFEKGMKRWSEKKGGVPAEIRSAAEAHKPGEPIRVNIGSDFKTLSIDKDRAGLAGAIGDVVFKKV